MSTFSVQNLILVSMAIAVSIVLAMSSSTGIELSLWVYGGNDGR